MAINSDRELIVSGHRDGTVRRWRVRTGEPVSEPLWGHYDCISGVAVSEDGNRIVSCSKDGDVGLWDALSGEAFRTPLRGNGGWVNCITLSRDAKLVMSGSMDGNVRHWDVSTERNGSEHQRLLKSLYKNSADPFPRSIFSLIVCGNGKIVVSGSKDGGVQR